MVINSCYFVWRLGGVPDDDGCGDCCGGGCGGSDLSCSSCRCSSSFFWISFWTAPQSVGNSSVGCTYCRSLNSSVLGIRRGSMGTLSSGGSPDLRGLEGDGLTGAAVICASPFAS